MVVEREDGNFDAIAGDELTKRLRFAYEVLGILLGNEEMPINTTADLPDE